MICDGCGKICHDKRTCFKIHGVPDWYKELNEQKIRNYGRNNIVHVVQGSDTQKQKGVKEDRTSMTDVVMELMTVLKRLPNGPIQANHTEDYADTSSPTLTPPLAPSLPEIEPIHISPTPSVAASPMSLVPMLKPEENFSGKRLWLTRLKPLKTIIPAKGCTQVEGVDYTESFSPVARSITLRLFLGIASSYSWSVHQLDVNNVFLHGRLDEEVYMTPPEGYLSLVLFASYRDRFMVTTEGFLPLLVYVDNILIIGPNEELIVDVKQHLNALFTIKDLGYVKYFLGLEITRSFVGMNISQRKYITDIITDTGLTEAKPILTPLPKGVKLSAEIGALLTDPKRYRRLIGRLLYLGFTRPDVSFAVQQLSQFLHHPTDQHWAAALHVVRYLKGTASIGLFFPASPSFQLMAYAGADWGSCVDSRRSVTGYYVFLGSSLISWKTKKQNTVSRSSAEAEYHAMAAAVCELQWITYLLQDFQIVVSTQSLSGATIKLPFTSPLTPFFTNPLNTWISTAILFVTNTRKASSNPPICFQQTSGS
ncbi:UNVERIFIED_CONTAM: Retrovirus-related Pol polyprotein from transposon RE1 [Sesamum radiatum]|uniref:Retrovirus-related Pol polyprotein from transposon RE1 n=1 Tax=Sesamum radiatum TaxID=300843 RepID=A0AAW2TYS7_SESRA